MQEKAKKYAIKAHKGQTRKTNGKAMIYHPLAVGALLESFGYDEHHIAAGYLHDTVEDTATTIEEIEEKFGSTVATLVMNASEPDKSLSWEERKNHTIELVSNKALDEIAVVLADKIHNIEDLTNEIQIQGGGVSIFSCFKRGVEKQLWYFDAIYNAVNTFENNNVPIVQRLGDALSKLKGEIKYQNELENEIFKDDKDLLEKLRAIHVLKYQLKETGYIKPFVIELLGTPRTGKTTIINNILDFFKKGGFRVSYFKELVTSEFYSTVNHLPLYERNMAIIEEIVKQLKSVRVNNFKSQKHKTKIKNDVDVRVFSQTGDIIVFDRGIYDRLIWFRRLLNNADINKKQYDELFAKYSEFLSLVNCLLCFTASAEVALKRDYISSLALEKRSFLTKENIESYNQALMDLVNEAVIKNYHLIDTNDKSVGESALDAVLYILKEIKNK